MPRPNRSNERRQELIPVIARTFTEVGYRRATTAELARRCGVQENILYRLWPDKRAMFVAAIECIYDTTTAIWERLLLDRGDGRSAAERLLDYEARHHGETGMYRIVFAGLSESDDPAIREALCRMYTRFQAFIARRLAGHRGGAEASAADALAAWALIGLGTVTEIGRELSLLGESDRAELWQRFGATVMDASSASPA